MLEKAIEFLRSRFPEENIEIITELLEESVKVKGGYLLLDAFENIILNAVRHNEMEKKRLWITVSKIQDGEEPMLKVEFKDNGIGISDNRKKTIFKRDYKGRRNTEGLGMGLSLVKEIVHKYGGKIWVENRIKNDYTKGSNFIILLKYF